MVLEELKKSFSAYADLWHVWCKQPYNGFTTIEVELIELYRKNDFVLVPGFIDMRTENLEIMNYLFKPLSQKLQNRYSCYTAWVVLKFQRFLLAPGFHNDIKKYLTASVDELPFEQATRIKLKECGYHSLEALITWAAEYDLQQLNHFQKVLKFKEEIQKYVESKH